MLVTEYSRPLKCVVSPLTSVPELSCCTTTARVAMVHTRIPATITSRAGQAHRLEQSTEHMKTHSSTPYVISTGAHTHLKAAECGDAGWGRREADIGLTRSFTSGMFCKLPCTCKDALMFDVLLILEALDDLTGAALGVGVAESGRFLSTTLAPLGVNWFRREVGLPTTPRRSAGRAAEMGRPGSAACLAALRGRGCCWVEETPVDTGLAELPRSSVGPRSWPDPAADDVRREPILNWVGL